MDSPFTVEQFIKVFHNYNLAVWPMQVLFYLLAIFLIYLAIIRRSFGDKFISIVLSSFWFWMGIIYHIGFFSVINSAAYLFGIIFIVQGFMFLYYGVFLSKLSYSFRPDIYGLTGTFFLLYALLFYPLVGLIAGHRFPDSPTFGLPCPTTIFTLGLFLWTDKKLPVPILIIPLLWSLIGTMAALNFGIKEDFGLLISGIVAGSLILNRDKRKGKFWSD
jgi:hypothetical protein